MIHSVYIGLKEINDLQQHIMEFVGVWVHTKKTPIPQKEIIAKMACEGIKDFTVANALNVLLKRGYLRRAVTVSNKTYYVQLRGI